MKLSLIVAAAQNGVIGRENQLPWHLPQDLKYFKATTLGKPIIMGRKTFESIGRPLPGRTNIVISRQPDWNAAGVLVAKSVEQALVLAGQVRDEQQQTADEVMVIGGAEIYRHALAIADRVYLTRVHADIDGDAYFPELPAAEWKKVSEVAGEADANLPHSFLLFERV
ncbi:MAG TPA: dihydrofolate reductase [Cellvibrio sp.]|nr:dihydrofolate reductase [Cellvibrio sp.]